MKLSVLITPTSLKPQANPGPEQMEQAGVSLTQSLQVSFADSKMDRKLWSAAEYNSSCRSDCHSILQLLYLPSNTGAVNMYILI